MTRVPFATPTAASRDQEPRMIPCPLDLCDAHDPDGGCVFVLDDQQWAEFQAMLHEPAKPTDAAEQANRLHRELRHIPRSHA